MKFLEGDSSGPIITGIVLGVAAPLLVWAGNPGNMGLCVACFLRDISGALGLHRAAVVQYLRPEIFALALGAFCAALLHKEWHPRGSSAAAHKFLLGAFGTVGALVFLGCPWRAFLRLGGGDANALLGIGGFIAGVGLGALVLKKGFTLHRDTTEASTPLTGLLMPLLALAGLALLLTKPLFSEGGALFFSEKGPGSMHAPVLWAFAAAFVLGYVAQRGRLCSVGAFRNIFLAKSFNLLWGVIAIVAAASVTNLALGQYHWGFENQPVAHTNHLWNFLGMLLAGLCFTLAEGCPGRQIVKASEGDGDSVVFIFGMIVGAAFAHNFNLASSGAGITAIAPWACLLGFVYCGLLLIRNRSAA